MLKKALKKLEVGKVLNKLDRSIVDTALRAMKEVIREDYPSKEDKIALLEKIK